MRNMLNLNSNEIAYTFGFYLWKLVFATRAKTHTPFHTASRKKEKKRAKSRQKYLLAFRRIHAKHNHKLKEKKRKEPKFRLNLFILINYLPFIRVCKQTKLFSVCIFVGTFLSLFLPLSLQHNCLLAQKFSFSTKYFFNFALSQQHFPTIFQSNTLSMQFPCVFSSHLLPIYFSYSPFYFDRMRFYFRLFFRLRQRRDLANNVNKSKYYAAKYRKSRII